MQTSKSIGNKIAEARKSNNLSQAELAQQVTISPQAVGKWERGESMPDLTTLCRLAEIFGTDLNYFTENFATIESNNSPKNREKADNLLSRLKTNLGLNWDMSAGNWVDADFSGLKNLKEKFSSSNIKNCKFLNSELSGLIFKGNNIQNSDFSNSDLSKSEFLASNISKNNFQNSTFIDAKFEASEINNCNFSNSNLSAVEFKNSEFRKNIIENTKWNLTSFKNTAFSEILFNGIIENCSFENCSFSKVKFENATITNTFFKNNRKSKNIQFINCKVDTITFAFLKSNGASLGEVQLLT